MLRDAADSQIANTLAKLEVIPTECLNADLVADIPVEWARAHQILPINYSGRLAALISDPQKLPEVDALAILLRTELQPLLAPADAIADAINRCYYQKKSPIQDPVPSSAPNQISPLPTAVSQSTDLLVLPDALPVQLVNSVLLEAVRHGASDIHLEPTENNLRVRYRLDGILYDQPPIAKANEAALVARLKVMAHLDIAEKRLPQDGMTKVRIAQREIDLRISTVPVVHGERVVLRLLNPEAMVRPLTDLGLEPALVNQLRQLLKETTGAIWVTGPTGSGKTTTLYAALQDMDAGQRCILTIEDPVEYQLPNLGQIAVKPKIGMNFAQGLRHILRQDPDVILVGEMRDLETAEIAVRAALTGHLVLSTLHTADAVGAVIRLVDMGIAPYLLAAATRAVLAQRLVRRLCPHCRRLRPIQPEERDFLAAADNRKSLLADGVWEAVGCAECHDGYRGRLGIYELLVFTEELQELVRRQTPPRELRASWQKSGHENLLADAARKIVAGQTSFEEIQRVLGSDEHVFL